MSRPSSVSAAFSLGTVILFTIGRGPLGPRRGRSRGRARRRQAPRLCGRDRRVAAAAAVAFCRPPWPPQRERQTSWQTAAAWSWLEPWPGPGPPCGRAPRRDRGPRCTRGRAPSDCGPRCTSAWSCAAAAWSCGPGASGIFSGALGRGFGFRLTKRGAASRGRRRRGPRRGLSRWRQLGLHLLAQSFLALAREAQPLGPQFGRLSRPLRHDGRRVPADGAPSKSTFDSTDAELDDAVGLRRAAAGEALGVPLAPRGEGRVRRRERRFFSRFFSRDHERARPGTRPPAGPPALAARLGLASGRGPARCACRSGPCRQCAQSGDVS